MTLNRFAKELFEKELQFDGKRIWKNERLFCCASDELIISIFLRKQSFGFFSLMIDVFPLIAPLQISGMEILTASGCSMNVLHEMLRADLISFSESMPYLYMRTKEPELSYEFCADMIHRFINPFLSNVHTIQQYYEQDVATVKMRMQKAQAENAVCFPNNTYWGRSLISCKQYILAYVGDYEGALLVNYTMGRPGAIPEYEVLSDAILKGDPMAIDSLFIKNYEENRVLLRQHLKLDLPERDHFVR